MHTNFNTALLGVSLDRTSKIPLHLQLTQKLQTLIQSHNWQKNEKLPASRQLAQELSISRSTVLTAINQLIAEGYLISKIGSGVFIAPHIPHIKTLNESTSKEAFSPAKSFTPTKPFECNLPDVENFPYKQWARHLEAAWQNPPSELLQNSDRFGFYPLRQTISDHLRAWRGVICDPAQIIITSGIGEAFGLITKLLNTRLPIYIESPCYKLIKQEFGQLGASFKAIDVDEHGFNPKHLAEPASAIIVTPSRHYPLGMTMPIARRIALLDWAKKNDALVIEDDYDSEFRYQGTPVPALASINQNDQTVYLGSFSKLFSPALRIGYFVIPQRFIDAMKDILHNNRTHASLTPQPALARFMQSGEFAVHVRRMRRLYAKRHRTLFNAIQQELSDYLTPVFQPTGLHLLCYINESLKKYSDTEIANLAARSGISLRALSSFEQNSPKRQGLILGFSAFDECQLEKGIKILREVLAGLPK